MRITWSVPVFRAGLGAGRGDLVRARALVRALAAAGHGVRAVEAAGRAGAEAEASAYRRIVRPLLPGAVHLGLRDAAWWWRSRGHGKRVARAARDHDADVIVETQVHGTVSGAVAAGATGLPLVLDDASPGDEPASLGAGLPSLAAGAFRRQREAARRLVVSSSFIRDRLVEGGVDPAGVEVLPNGVDLRAHDEAGREAARARIGAGGETVVVGFVGSFQPWHRVELLVPAFRALARRRPSLLLLVGDGPGREPALERARTLDIDHRIVAPGTVPADDVPGLLAACDIGVLPGTNAYGHPMKLLEYAAAGLAVVAPELPPVREVVEHGVDGFLFPPGEEGALTATLIRLASDPETRERFGDAARERARDAAWTARGAALARLLERVVDEAAAKAPAGAGGPGRGER